MDGVTRLWAMRRSKWIGADGGLCARRVCAEGTYEGNGQHIYRRSGVWDGEAWVRTLGGLCSRRVCVEGTYEGKEQRVYRRSGVWGGEAWVRNLGDLCLRRVWVGDAPDGGGAAANGERRVQRLLDMLVNYKRHIRHLT